MKKLPKSKLKTTAEQMHYVSVRTAQGILLGHVQVSQKEFTGWLRFLERDNITHRVYEEIAGKFLRIGV